MLLWVNIGRLVIVVDHVVERSGRNDPHNVLKRRSHPEVPGNPSGRLVQPVVANADGLLKMGALPIGMHSLEPS